MAGFDNISKIWHYFYTYPFERVLGYLYIKLNRMEQQIKANQQVEKTNVISLFFKKLGSKISDLFEPEEVEVTFKMEGKKRTYTYTKVTHKQVA